ncbi:MAG: hypothetical protein A2020_11050 [Lentisphaerae bacterium GWF2_45_14]|nr:MAG: hypothetical protein A2020_11050 [Lentisphaerae bacterium GWF2_45_14]
MFRTQLATLLLAATFLCLCGCTSERPVLYPNKHLKKVGKTQAEKDIDESLKMAEEYKLNSTDYAEKGKKTAVGTVAGAAAGTAVGAIRGGPGLGAVTGAAGGAAGGTINCIFGSSNPPKTYRKFVETYLREKGYQVIGWD